MWFLFSRPNAHNGECRLLSLTKIILLAYLLTYLLTLRFLQTVPLTVGLLVFRLLSGLQNPRILCGLLCFTAFQIWRSSMTSESWSLGGRARICERDSCLITLWTCNFLSAMYRHSHCHQFSLSCVSMCHLLLSGFTISCGIVLMFFWFYSLFAFCVTLCTVECQFNYRC